MQRLSISQWFWFEKSIALDKIQLPAFKGTVKYFYGSNDNSHHLLLNTYLKKKYLVIKTVGRPDLQIMEKPPGVF